MRTGIRSTTSGSTTSRRPRPVPVSRLFTRETSDFAEATGMNLPTTSSLAAGAATIAAVAIGACSGPRAQGVVSNEPPTVAVAKVTHGDIAQVLTVAAEFRPFQEIEVFAKVSGYLKSINVDVG